MRLPVSFNPLDKKAIFQLVVDEPPSSIGGMDATSEKVWMGKMMEETAQKTSIRTETPIVDRSIFYGKPEFASRYLVVGNNMAGQLAAALNNVGGVTAEAVTKPDWMIKENKN